jgi:hypothetical protein
MWSMTVHLCMYRAAELKQAPNPTDRGKSGTKHHVLNDVKGTPLVAIITGANRNYQTQLMPLVEHIR